MSSARRNPGARGEADELTDAGFESLLNYMRDSRGFDFTGYKRASLMRRVRHRMQQAGYPTFDEYLDVLQASSEEFSELFNTILINVTDFFRDPDSWEFVKTDVIPALLADRGPDRSIRIWSAGCASGQEAYSIAMLFAEALGIEAFRQRVKIYATDLDEDALTQARAAVYDTKAVASVPEEWREKYFERVGARCAFRKDLRRALIFGRNDLVKDAPISRVDLLVCRNTLMYLNGETQRTVVARLHFALSPGGFLFLGHAEMLLNHSDQFTPVSLENRVFKKSVGSRAATDTFNQSTAILRHGDTAGINPTRDMAFRASPVPQIVVTNDETVALINEAAAKLFGLSSTDVGRVFRDLEVSYRPLELRGYLERAKVERRPTRIQDVKWDRPASDTTWLEVQINPLVDHEKSLLGISIVFLDVTGARTLLDKVIQANSELEEAYAQLQSTNEELETTNEELQSTVEELETTNEELQSTNEELETMNEELQSTNDELNTINDELRRRTVELGEARTMFNSLVDSIPLGMAVVDREMRVVVWNHRCEELWGVRLDETAGTVLTSLDIGLPMDDIKSLIGSAFVDPDFTGKTTVDAVNRRGKNVKVRVTCSSFRPAGGGVNGALLLMEAQ